MDIERTMQFILAQQAKLEEITRTLADHQRELQVTTQFLAENQKGLQETGQQLQVTTQFLAENQKGLQETVQFLAERQIRLEDTTQVVVERQSRFEEDTETITARQSQMERIILEVGRALASVADAQAHASQILDALAERQVASDKARSDIEEAINRLVERQKTTEENLNVLLLTVERHIANHK